MDATYSPEDNKLRLYPLSRLPKNEFERVRATGFIWAPKQELFVAPAWTPEREDLLLELCGEIGDEDTSLAERAEERAERFDEYSDKREADAERARKAVDAIADQIPLGQPILVGHHSEKHARKDAERIENGMRKAVKLWETAKYWTDRAAGAIRNAKYKELPAVRARRIKGLEADKRKQEREKAQLETSLKLWDNKGQPLPLDKAKAIANCLHDGGLILPNGESTWSAWSALQDGQVTPESVQEARRTRLPELIARRNRWIAHLDNRLAYERAMMAEAGGIVADRIKPEKGGAVRCWASPGYGKGWSYIKRVNKVSVTVEDNWGNGGKNFTRTIPFDKLKAVMTKAEVEAARAEGKLFDSATGFFLEEKAETRQESRERVHQEAIEARDNAKEAEFDALKASLKAGVQVVSAPQLFPTPTDLAARVVELAEIHEGHRILEPSAGTGSLCKAIRSVAPEASIEAVEINSHLCQHAGKWATSIRQADFLTLNGELGTFDRIVMNPPFANADDIKHIEHALTKLNPGGRLVAICANGPRQREKLQPLADQWIDLPAGSFQEAGTSVNAAIVVIDR
jgi:16S rRNA G1207 methylase RsmC